MLTKPVFQLQQDSVGTVSLEVTGQGPKLHQLSSDCDSTVAQIRSFVKQIMWNPIFPAGLHSLKPAGRAQILNNRDTVTLFSKSN